MKAKIARVVGWMSVAYAAVCAGGALGYRKVLFPAPRNEGPSTSLGGTLELVKSADGINVQVLSFAAVEGAPTLVHFHGNGETLRDLVLFGGMLRARGVAVSLVEFRGYGSSEGAPSEAAFYADAEAVLDGIERKGVARERIVLSGTSLGTGVAAEMARRGRGARLVLITPYTSIPAVAQAHVPILPMRFLMRDVFDTLGKADEIKVPTLIVHGDDDEVVPYAMGRTLALRLPNATLLTIPGGRHNDLFSREGDRLRDAIAAHAKGDASASR
jgi:hypothetical protein